MVRSITLWMTASDDRWPFPRSWEMSWHYLWLDGVVLFWINCSRGTLYDSALQECSLAFVAEVHDILYWNSLYTWICMYQGVVKSLTICERGGKYLIIQSAVGHLPLLNAWSCFIFRWDLNRLYLIWISVCDAYAWVWTCICLFACISASDTCSLMQSPTQAPLSCTWTTMWWKWLSTIYS